MMTAAQKHAVLCFTQKQASVNSLVFSVHTARAGGDLSSAHSQHPHAGLHAGKVLQS